MRAGLLGKTTVPRSSRAVPAQAVNQSNVGSSPTRAPPPAAFLLPGPASSPPAPGPARYNYSPLIRPGRESGSLGEAKPLASDIANLCRPPPQQSCWATSQACPLTQARARGLPQRLGSLPRLAVSPSAPGKITHTRFLPPRKTGSPPTVS